MTPARKLREQKGSAIAFAGSDLPGRAAKSAMQLIAEAPKKFHRFVRHEKIDRNQYIDGMAVGHLFLDAECKPLASWEEVAAAVKRGELWEG